MLIVFTDRATGLLVQIYNSFKPHSQFWASGPVCIYAYIGLNYAFLLPATLLSIVSEKSDPGITLNSPVCGWIK